MSPVDQSVTYHVLFIEIKLPVLLSRQWRMSTSQLVLLYTAFYHKYRNLIGYAIRYLSLKHRLYMLSCVCRMIDHRWRQTVVTTKNDTHNISGIQGIAECVTDDPTTLLTPSMMFLSKFAATRNLFIHLSTKEANCCLWWRHLGASVFSSRFQWNPSKNQSKRRYDSADFIIRDTMVSGPTVCGNEQLQ